MAPSYAVYTRHVGCEIVKGTNVKVPFNRLQEPSRAERARLLGEISDVIASGIYINGPKTERFLSEFGSYVGSPHVVPVGNGTDALEVALRALGVSAGETVYTVANAGGYSTTAIRQLGAHPTFIDVSPDDLQICPESLAQTLQATSKKPSALVVTHLFGAMAPVQEVVKICEPFGIPVVEDCAQAIGVRSQGRHVGTFGKVATFSFYPTKNLGGVGDAGAIGTDDPLLAEKISSLAQYGWTAKYTVEEPLGRNSRMDEVQAAVLLGRLERIDESNRERLSIYRELSSANLSIDFVHRDSPNFNAHLAVLRVQNRVAAEEYFAQCGIETVVHYPIPDHKQRAYEYIGEPLSVTEESSTKVLSIPCHPRLSRKQVDGLLDALTRAPFYS